ncbi:autophagy-related protein 11 [Geosmithia morbida]|uniref:Autophagy-related protein 11 n=1 Tax=Geosmithia morbida TaxID=1094350 RepID=A0A9P4YYG0_9HYPO|nr:autophagy-related protein 11 [Geosmithia morbida]KAF4124102.1 autophagy-related protein 11 [Geosmithia morbida]
MATQVFIAHTGQRLQVQTAQFTTLDDFKTWVVHNSSVSPQHLIALTPHGRSLKPSSLYSEPSSPDSVSSVISQVPPPKRYTISNAPNTIDDVQDIASWQELYKERRTWAVTLLADCAAMNTTATSCFEQMDVMIKCLDAAVANLEISVKQIEPKYVELKKWVDPALVEHDRLASSWQAYLALARSVPVSSSVVKFMTRGQVAKDEPTLEDLVEPETAKKAGKLASTARRRFSDKAAELQKMSDKMYRALNELFDDFGKLTSRSVLGRSDDTSHLLEDIEVIVGQIDSDYRTALGYGGSQRDVAQASKTASNHTERLVPNLMKRAKEMDDMVQYAVQCRNTIASDTVRFMRAITDITSYRSNFKDQINAMNQSEDDLTTFDYLRLIQQLPYMYASFLAEAIRRHEWNDKIKNDSSTLANEMALYQDEESKRRRKWQKMVGSTYGPSLDTNVMGLEVSVLGGSNPWPVVNKNELENFLQTLKGLDTEQAILDDISQLLHELLNPTKQQLKRFKAFKNGSIHESSLGRSGLMIRGDDELMRSLQDDKSRLESKSQAFRPGNLFQAQMTSIHERNGSTSSVKQGVHERSRSSSDATDALARRNAELENELRQEKERNDRIQKDLSTRATQNNDMEDKIQEVNSTKKDLLENMEALKREFVEERKSLEDEIKTLKARLEDTEVELEQFGDSRDEEKATYSERVQHLEAELDRSEKERKDEALKAQGQVEFLRNEARIQREQRDSIERELEEAKKQGQSHSKKAEETQEIANGYLQSLKALHLQLCPEDMVPSDSDLADSVQTRVTDWLGRFRNMESDSALVRQELEQARSQVKELRGELASTKEQLASKETSTREAWKNATETKARKRVDEEEKKMASLKEELASRQSQVGRLEEELILRKEKLDSTESKLSELTARYESRDERSMDLTRRLYSQNDRMCHLLERIGYSVSRKDAEMTITKVPRAERAAQNPNDSSDPGTSLRKSATLGAKALHESADLDLLYWPSSADAKTEADKYSLFLKKLGDFDTDAFSDTVVRRIKEVEYKARKWQKDARSYRDRAHALQRDSHDKIAYKHFKEGDLALFLPTRNQQAGAWAAFNVGFPHYFLRELDGHRLRNREWLVARITRIQERVVDLSKSLQQGEPSANEGENDNPFQLSDGLRWYLIDAQEDKPGAPATPGMGRSTVAANTVEATANLHTHATGVSGKGKKRDSVASIEGINKTLSKSLESRRSSSSSKRALPFAGGQSSLLKSNPITSETNSLRAGAGASGAPGTPTAGTSPVQTGHMSTKPEGSGAATTTAAKEPAKVNSKADGETAQKKQAGSSGGQGGEASKITEPNRRLEREESAGSSTKKSVVWDPLWKLDYTYESQSKKT